MAVRLMAHPNLGAKSPAGVTLRSQFEAIVGVMLKVEGEVLEIFGKDFFDSVMQQAKKLGITPKAKPNSKAGF